MTSIVQCSRPVMSTGAGGEMYFNIKESREPEFLVRAELSESRLVFKQVCVVAC